MLPKTSRPLWVLLLALAASSVVAETNGPVRQVKLLTIGNSFADNATQYLPDLARAAGQQVVVFRANLGGHSLQQHVGYLQAFEANPDDPAGRPYKNRVHPRTGQRQNFSLPEALAAEKWDYVTIQQLSSMSYKPESYEPYAGILIDTIRKYAPQAEILVHQTWAYREDHPFFADRSKFSQEQMFEGLSKAYRQLADRYKLRIIPVGAAFQNARATKRWDFQFPDPDFDYKNPPVSQTPDQPGSLMVGWGWGKNKLTKEPEFKLDAIHANEAGKFLGAAVFYEVLFNDDVEDVPFQPAGLNAEAAEDLGDIAHDTVERIAVSQPRS
jgi:hypothetical protein